ncbi:MAG: hypothetical protein JXA67_19285, partial [Micromonosporaceae bacterium]|nr:hypothetical protein [Micromonosporaceae bacterium]
PIQHPTETAPLVRMSRLLRTPPPGAIYVQPERHGITVVVLPASGLRPDELASLNRIGQASPAGSANQASVANQTSIALSAEAAEDLHLLAGVPRTGEILCHTAFTTLPAPAGCTLRTPGRQLFSVERVHTVRAHDLLPDLRRLPDLPVARVRELAPLAHNRYPAASRLEVTRAVVELGTAAFRLVVGPLRSRVDAVVGEMAARPFVYLTRDLLQGLPRVTAIDAALDLQGKAALLALLRLKQEHFCDRFWGKPGVQQAG